MAYIIISLFGIDVNIFVSKIYLLIICGFYLFLTASGRCGMIKQKRKEKQHDKGNRQRQGDTEL